MNDTRSGELLARRFSRLCNHYWAGGLSRAEFLEASLDCVSRATSPGTRSDVDDFLEEIGTFDVYTDCLLVLAAELQAGVARPADHPFPAVSDTVLARLIHPGDLLRTAGGPASKSASELGPPDEDGLWLAIELLSRMKGPGARETLDRLGWLAERQGWTDAASSAAARLPRSTPGSSPGLELALLQADPRLADEPELMLDAALAVAADGDGWDTAAVVRLSAIVDDWSARDDRPLVNQLSRAAVALWRRGASEHAERVSRVAVDDQVRSASISPELWAMEVAPVAGVRLRMGHQDQARELAQEVLILSESWWHGWVGLQSRLIAAWVMAETADGPEECLTWCEHLRHDIDHCTLGPLQVRGNRLAAHAFERLGDQRAAREAAATAETVAEKGQTLSLHLSDDRELRELTWDIETTPLEHVVRR